MDKPEKIEPHFATNNAVLASALALAGIPWLDDNEPAQTQYDERYLDSVKCRTVKEAKSKGHPGKFCFFFKRHPDLDACLKAFDAAQEKVSLHADSGEPVPFLEGIPMADRAEIVGTVLKIHALIKDAPLNNPNPWLVFWEDGEIEKTKPGESGEFTATIPAHKRIRANASAGLKEKMGL